MTRLSRVVTATLVLWLATRASVAAQGPAMRLGPVAGITFATIGGDDAEDISNRIGYQVGGFVSLAWGSTFALQPEVVWVMKGAENDAENFTINLSYLQVPVLARVRFPVGAGSRVTPFLSAGPSFAFKVDCTVEEDSAEEPCEDEASTDFSLVFGGGLEVGDFTIAGRYDLGFTNLDTSPDRFDLKNRSWSIVVGYGFRLGAR
jgi:hypothetical protein